MIDFYLSFSGNEPKYIYFFSNLLSTTNIMQAILNLFLLKEQKQGDIAIEGNNVGTECVMDYSNQFTTYSVIILSFCLSEILLSIINVTLIFQILSLNNEFYV